jgi:hypothetical protein
MDTMDNEVRETGGCLASIVFTLFLLLTSCGILWSVKYDFICTTYITLYTPCPVVISIPTILDNATYDRMRDFEQANQCCCKPYVCP